MAKKTSSSSKPNVWVSPRPDGRWEVQREGSKKPVRVTDTKKEAQGIGKDVAKNNGVELIVQRQDGTIQSKDSFGNDPNPPKDTEH